MKNIRWLICLMFGVATVLSTTVLADRGRVGVGIYLGNPHVGWYYHYPFYPYPYYPYPYYPPVTTEPEQPQVYIEKDAPESEQQMPNPQGYWYYCDKPQGYYPYISECPGGWQAVVPTPPSLR